MTAGHIETKKTRCVAVAVSINWALVFARRPDLEPPGYRETLQRLAARPPRPKKKKKAKR